MDPGSSLLPSSSDCSRAKPPLAAGGEHEQPPYQFAPLLLLLACLDFVLLFNSLCSCFILLFNDPFSETSIFVLAKQC